MERRLVYIVTCSFRLVFSFVRFVTYAWSSACSCIHLCAPPWREVYWISVNSACALMEWTWNFIHVLLCYTLDRQFHQYYWNLPISRQGRRQFGRAGFPRSSCSLQWHSWRTLWASCRGYWVARWGCRDPIVMCRSSKFRSWYPHAVDVEASN